MRFFFAFAGTVTHNQARSESGSAIAMLIARALLAKVRPPRLNPREIQDQVDVTRAAVLTAAYALGQQQRHAHGDETYSYDQLEKETAALKPPARKLRVQMAINDQVSATTLFAVHFSRIVPGPVAGGGL